MNEGFVIASDISYTKKSWIFTTIKNWVNNDHPVSGSREFNYTENTDGSYTFYTKATERTENNWTNLYEYITKPANENTFEKTDHLWKHFQKNIETFVNNHGGRANVQAPQIERPDRKKVKEVLQNKKPVTELGCS